jgi:AcrR family transcriptional regulator
MATKTKGAIVSEFLKLVETRQFDKITVTDLVEQCNISRQTFYYHFDDIEKMLEWTFLVDTDFICNKIKESEDISHSAEFFTNFMNKYDTLFKSAIKTSHFIYIYNLLGDVVYAVTRAYFSKIYKVLNNSHEVLIKFWANSILSYAVYELQKENSNYDEVFKCINAFIPKHS